MRDFARISMTIWNDDDFLDLSPRAQHLYMVLLSSPALSYVGVTDWRPARLSAMAHGWTKTAVIAAAGELSRAHFIVVDQESEEVLVRSFVRNDPIMRQPNLATSMARAYAVVGSRSLKGVIVHELKRLKKEQPELAGWKSEEAQVVLKKRAIDPSDDPCGHPSIDPSIEGQVDPSVDPSIDPQPKGAIDPSDDPSIDPCPTTATATHNLNPQPSTGGYGGRERYGARAREAEPPSEIPPEWVVDPRRARCAAHAGMDRPPACGACADARRAAEDARSRKADAERDAARERRETRDACDLCDPNGLVRVGGKLTRCPHDPDRLAAMQAAAEEAPEPEEPPVGTPGYETPAALTDWRRKWRNRTQLLDGETHLPAIEHDPDEVPQERA